MTIKYPRTFHLPFSPEIHADDKTMKKEFLSNLLNREVIITEKLDGGNCCLTKTGVYARTRSELATHPSFDPVKGMQAGIKYIMPNNVQLFGENMYGIHTIKYDNLVDYFYLFNVLKDDKWLSWDEVCLQANRYGLQCVPLLFRGTFSSLSDIQSWMDREIISPSILGSEREGFVIRIADSFDFEDFNKFTAKYVRYGHVQEDAERWEVNWKPAKILKR